MADLQFCKTEKKGHLLIVTLNRPERMNALHPPASDELSGVFDDFSKDANLWVAIVTGMGERAFSAGNDLKYQSEGHSLVMPDTGFAGLTNRFDLKKPIIAAVNGIAMGGGFEIALACDIILASENAVFALPEPRVGLAALAGGLHRLPRQIPYKQAMSMILTGRRVSAEEGMKMGFVSGVFSQKALMEEAQKWADMILACSPASLKASIAVAEKGLSHAGLQDALQDSYPEVRQLLESEDAVEGPLAFAEKRPPKWKGV